MIISIDFHVTSLDIRGSGGNRKISEIGLGSREDGIRNKRRRLVIYFYLLRYSLKVKFLEDVSPSFRSANVSFFPKINN